MANHNGLTKAKLGRVGTAALAAMGDAQVERDPARAFHVAQAAMRATLEAHNR